ncbi:Rne/Rng family ribonuclease [Geminicoccus roseus]|uniref:Rne/Rng family ribonuclease n=1 Tax=Geminicoccus roseus TaxID=404900 RepID=UPI0004824A41|nr:ribonuclease E/G [Geminicoccus roseus]
MTRRMLIDAGHPEETRVVVLNDEQLVDFDFESSTKKQIKGNVYLAKVTRVEPSLQAAFIEYGGNRHGFLAFSEIHPDYFQIPQADRAMLDEVARADEDDANGSDDDDDDADLARKRARLLRSYKIQEVIKRRQIMLVQVVKEERGTKGAALTTYLSLAGRYCVLMPNTPRGGGISRKIEDAEDRKRLKEAAAELDVPKGMGLIIRTAGQERTKAEIRRDYEYLLRQWEDIRETTLKSMAPSLIYEEGDLVKRAMRDLYSRDIEEVLVEGDEAYKQAKRIMTMLMPSRSRRVKQYRDEVPLFFRHGVEDQLDAMHLPKVELPSGGTIVIHTTEALTAIDVNSGRATRERHIDETALKTNLEAADEVARQMRLRDLAGLIVIDFIDMADQRHERQVERRLRDALKMDRARLQIGKISQFGLLELSRQRMRPSLQELSTQTCPVCHGLGVVRSTESCALHALRRIQEVGIAGETAVMRVVVPGSAAYYLLNQKRDALFRMEQRYQMRVFVDSDDQMIPGEIGVERLERREKPIDVPAPVAAPVLEEEPAEEPEIEDEDEELVERPASRGGDERRGEGRRGRRGDRRGRRDERTEDRAAEAPAIEQPAYREPVEAAEGAEDAPDEAMAAPVAAAPSAEDGEDGGKKRRRRRRRRRRGGDRGGEQQFGAEQNLDDSGDEGDEEGEGEAVAEPASFAAPQPAEAVPDQVPADSPVVPLPAELVAPLPVEVPQVEVSDEEDAAEEVAAAEEAPAEAPAPEKPKRRSRAKKPVAEAAEEAPAKPAAKAKKAPARSRAKAAPAAAEAAAPEAEEKPKRRRAPAKKAAAPKAQPAEAEAAPAPAETAPAASEAPATPAPAAPEPAAQPAPEPANEPAAPEPAAPEPAAAEAPARPVRRGWWNRLTGS